MLPLATNDNKDQSCTVPLLTGFFTASLLLFHLTGQTQWQPLLLWDLYPQYWHCGFKVGFIVVWIHFCGSRQSKGKTDRARCILVPQVERFQVFGCWRFVWLLEHCWLKPTECRVLIQNIFSSNNVIRMAPLEHFHCPLSCPSFVYFVVVWPCNETRWKLLPYHCHLEIIFTKKESKWCSVRKQVWSCGGSAWPPSRSGFIKNRVP